jgi:hypothetical protein
MKPESVAHYLAKIEAESAREARIDERAAMWQRWLDKTIEGVIEGGGDVDVEPADLLAELMAALHDVIDQEGAQRDAAWRREVGDLRRQLVEREIAHTAERRSRTLEAARLRKRITTLEARLDDETHEREALAKTLGIVQREIAKDRALHRMRDGRRLFPAAQRADLEKARRKTDRAIEDRSLDGGRLDA